MKNETSLLKVHTFFVKIFAKICCPISKPLCPIIFLIFLFVLSRLFYAETTVSRNETSNQDTSKTRMSNGFVKKNQKSNPNKDCTAFYATLLNLRRFYSMHYCTTCMYNQSIQYCLFDILNCLFFFFCLKRYFLLSFLLVTGVHSLNILSDTVLYVHSFAASAGHFVSVRQRQRDNVLGHM